MLQDKFDQCKVTNLISNIMGKYMHQWKESIGEKVVSNMFSSNISAKVVSNAI